MYAGGNDTEGVEDGPDSAIWKRTGDVHDPGKYRGITSTETAGEGFRHKDQNKSRR